MLASSHVFWSFYVQAGWLWFPLCAFSCILAFFFMSNQPNHGEKSTITSLINFCKRKTIHLSRLAHLDPTLTIVSSNQP